jgi:O-antigen ligase
MVIAILAWGVFALGASRPWGYVPLLTAMAAYGLVGIAMQHERRLVGRGLGYSLVIACGAISLQVVPVPTGVVNVLSPERLRFSDANISSAVSTLSVAPSATIVGLASLVALGLFFVGTLASIERDDVWPLVAGLLGLATMVALVGIAEASRWWDGIYKAASLPLPPDSTPHGPFSSKNHYVAWMLMGLAIALGRLCASVTQHNHRLRRLAVQCMATAMAVAVVQTKSRAGVLGVAVAVAVMGWLLMRRRPSARTGIFAAAPLAALLIVGVGVTGIQPIVGRFVTNSWSTAHGRLPIWQQAIAIARDFPVAGSGINTYQRIVGHYPTAAFDGAYEGAHNDYLQLAAEGGLLVVLPALATVAFFVRDTRRRLSQSSPEVPTYWIRAGAIVGISLIALQEIVEFSLQVPANSALFVVLAAIAMHRSPAEKGIRSHA